MGERIFGLPLTTEQLAEKFLGKLAPEAFLDLIRSMPNVKKVRFISFIRGLKWAKDPDYPHLGKQLEVGLAKVKVFDRKTLLAGDFWAKRLEDLKRIEVPLDSPVKAEELAKSWESWSLDGDEEDVYVAFSSKVLVKSSLFRTECRHIPLLDFTCVPSSNNLAMAREMLIYHGDSPGLILNSGASFHYWGLRSLLEKDWKTWIDNLITFRGTKWWTKGGSLLDLRFLERSLTDGENFLRLTSGLEKREIPRVVDVI